MTSQKVKITEKKLGPNKDVTEENHSNSETVDIEGDFEDVIETREVPIRSMRSTLLPISMLLD